MIKVKTKAELKALCDDLSANLHDINTSDITDMGGLFKDSLRSDFSFINTWNTSNVTSMISMFENCINLNEKLEINAKSLKDTCKMFYGCSNLDLKNINFHNFDTSKLYLSSGMLTGCKNITELITRYAKLDFKNGLLFPKTKGELMFLLNDRTLSLNLIDISNIEDTKDIFAYSDRTDFSGIENWGKVNALVFINSMASNELLVSLKCIKPNAKYYPKNHYELKALCNDESVYLGDIDTSFIVYMGYLFEGSKRKDFNGINGWNTSNVMYMQAMFYECVNFNEKLSFDTSNVVSMSQMFYGCKSFNQSLDFDTSKVKDMFEMFYGCTKFNQKLDFDTSSVEDMFMMFDGCESLEVLPKFYTEYIDNFCGL